MKKLTVNNDQFEQLRICKIANNQKEKRRCIDRITYKGIDRSRVERNNRFLQEIENILPSRMDTHKLFTMGHAERLSFMNTLSKTDKDEVNNLIHSLFM